MRIDDLFDRREKTVAKWKYFLIFFFINLLSSLVKMMSSRRKEITDIKSPWKINFWSNFSIFFFAETFFMLRWNKIRRLLMSLDIFLLLFRFDDQFNQWLIESNCWKIIWSTLEQDSKKLRSKLLREKPTELRRNCVFDANFHCFHVNFIHIKINFRLETEWT